MQEKYGSARYQMILKPLTELGLQLHVYKSNNFTFSLTLYCRERRRHINQILSTHSHIRTLVALTSGMNIIN